MNIAVAFVIAAVLQTAAGAVASNESQTAESRVERAVGLHCFVCSTLVGEKNCGDPFEAVGVPIKEFPGKSVCYKWKIGDEVIRGGMLDSEYMDLYTNDSLDVYPLRGRCSAHLCNAAVTPAPAPAALALAALLAAAMLLLARGAP